jgi:hypothetical protein
MINQKSYQHQQKHQMKLILALIIITNKLMNDSKESKSFRNEIKELGENILHQY